jgi:hypothetical protein
MTIAEIAAELGLDPATLKPEVVAKVNSYFSEAEAMRASGEKALQDSQALERVIDQNIAQFGSIDAANMQLSAQLAAIKAAQEDLERNGVKLDLKLPKGPNPVDPVKQLQDMITGGFSNMAQAMEVNNQYLALNGKPMPDSPSLLADEAVRNRMTVAQWADQKYGLTKKQQEVQQAQRQKEMDDYAAKQLQTYKDAHPNNAGHPELNGGFPSNYPAVAAPRDNKTVGEFARLSTREKIVSAMQRAVSTVNTQNAA